MDRFSYTLFIKNIENTPAVYSTEEFTNLLLTLSPEDLNELQETLLKTPLDLPTAKHVIALMDILWHYQ